MITNHYEYTNRDLLANLDSLYSYLNHINNMKVSIIAIATYNNGESTLVETIDSVFESNIQRY